MVAYVYLIQEEPAAGETTGHWTKIGYSSNPPEWRMDSNLKRGNPRTISVAAAFEYETVVAAHTAEQAAHAHFSAYRHQKEWFRVPWQEVCVWFETLGHARRVDPPKQ